MEGPYLTDLIREHVPAVAALVAPEPLRYAVVGSRGFPRGDVYVIDYVVREVNDVCPEAILVSGRSPGGGPDVWGENAYLNLKRGNPPPDIYPPEFDKYGSPKALFVRNRQIADRMDMGFAFWHNTSSGTADLLKLAHKQRKRMIVIHSDWRFEVRD